MKIVDSGILICLRMTRDSRVGRPAHIDTQAAVKSHVSLCLGDSAKVCAKHADHAGAHARQLAGLDGCNHRRTVRKLSEKRVGTKIKVAVEGAHNDRMAFSCAGRERALDAGDTIPDHK